MDPEIQKALQDGYPPSEIIAELQRRGQPVPPELVRLAQSEGRDFGDALREASGVAAPAAAAGAGVALGSRVGQRVNETVRPSFRAEARLGRAVRAEGGVNALIQRLQDYNRTGRKDLVLSDLGPALAAEADFAANANDDLRSVLTQIHGERRRQQPQRLINDVEQVAPGGYVDAPGRLQAIGAEKAAFAAGPEGYEGLRQANPTIAPAVAPRLGTFLESPKLANVWADASAVGAIGPLPPAQGLSFEVLQNLKERLDGLSDAAWRKGDGDLGKRLGAARDELVQILVDGVPNYAEVAARYAAYGQQERAIEAGLEAWSNRQLQLPELQRQINSLQPGDLELFRQGVLGGYLRDVENARTNQNFARRMLDESVVQQAKLELIFGGEEGFAEALARYEKEISMGRLGEIVGGSQTHRRGMAAGIDALETGADVATMGPAGAVRSAVQRAPGMMARAEARHLAPRFSARGSDELLKLLRALRF